jgi:hypothetical protein
MGSSQSTQSSVASHEQLLDRLSGSEAIPFEDAFWGHLLNLHTPLASEDPERVEEAMVPHCRQLMVHNPITHNFQRLVLHALDLVSAAQGGKPSLAVANALHIVSVILKYMIETGSPSTLSMAFEASSGLPPAVQGRAHTYGCCRQASQLPTRRGCACQSWRTVATHSMSVASSVVASALCSHWPHSLP